VRTSSTTFGSRSMYRVRGTYLPLSVENCHSQNGAWFEQGKRVDYTSLGEKGTEALIVGLLLLFLSQVSIWLNTMFETVKFPAGIGDLNTGLADCNFEQRYALAMFYLGGTMAKGEKWCQYPHTRFYVER
jgi:hypothetical protein